MKRRFLFDSETDDVSSISTLSRFTEDLSDEDYTERFTQKLSDAQKEGLAVQLARSILFVGLKRQKLKAAMASKTSTTATRARTTLSNLFGFRIENFSGEYFLVNDLFPLASQFGLDSLLVERDRNENGVNGLRHIVLTLLLLSHGHLHLSELLSLLDSLGIKENDEAYDGITYKMIINKFIKQRYISIKKEQNSELSFGPRFFAEVSEDALFKWIENISGKQLSNDEKARYKVELLQLRRERLEEKTKSKQKGQHLPTSTPSASQSQK